MSSLDERLLRWTEAFCHRFQLWTGKTNFWLARVAHLLAVLLLAMAGLTGSRTQDVWLLSGAVGSFGWMYANIMWAEYARVEAYYREPHDTAHPTTLIWRSLSGSRGLTLVLGLGALIAGAIGIIGPAHMVLWYVGAFGCWLASQYLQCVIPLPPGGSRARAWLNALRAAWTNPLPSPS